MSAPDTSIRQAPAGTCERDLRAILSRRAATRPLADGILARIDGGLSNEAWRLDAVGATWFVRRNHADAERLGIDRDSECRVLQAVATAGLAPEVLACAPTDGLLVTRFVDGMTWQATDVQQPANLARIAERLRRLHALAIPEGVRVVTYADQASRLAAGLPAMDAMARALWGKGQAALTRIAARKPVAALCHHDLHHLNMLDDGSRLWIVDWEYGGRGDPLFDIAGFLAMHELPPQATADFLAAYGRLRPADLERLDDARWVFDYVQWLWYRSRYPRADAGIAARIEGLAQRLLRCNN